MSRVTNILLLLFLPIPAWAGPSAQQAPDRGCTVAGSNGACRIPWPYSASPQAAAGVRPLSTGSSIGIAATTSESSATQIIPHVMATGTSQGSGNHQAMASLAGPGTVAAGGYTQSLGDVKTSLFHLGNTTRITTDSISNVKDYSWATATSTGTGQTTLKATGSAASSTSAFVSAGGATASASGKSVSTAVANAAFTGPGTANVSTTAWSNSASQAQVVLNNGVPVSSSASTVNQSGGTSQVSISHLPALPLGGSPTHASLMATGAANMPGPGSSGANQPSGLGLSSGKAIAAPMGGSLQAAPHANALSAGAVTQMIMSGKSPSAAVAAAAKGK